MSSYTQVLSKSLKFSPKPLKDDIDQRKDGEFFRPTGTQVYFGTQGSGKTLSAVKHAIDIKKVYSKSIVVSNLDLYWLKPISISLDKDQQNEVNLASTAKLSDALTKQFLDSNLKTAMQDLDPTTSYIQFSSMDDLSVVLTGVNNGFKGVLYLIDEIHTFMNSLDSKNIPMFVFTEISQQRKQRKVIIGTSQLFMRVAKPIREQCDNAIKCRTWFNLFTIQTAYDGMTLEQNLSGALIGTKRRTGFFFHTRELRSSYDTYQKVVSSSEQYEQQTASIQLDRKTSKALKIK